jgi:RNA polymerase sigma factor (sigma-70 family)
VKEIDMTITLRRSATAGDQPHRESMQRRATSLSLISNTRRTTSSHTLQAHPTGIPAQFGSAAASVADAKSSRTETVTSFNAEDQPLAEWMNAAQAGDRTAYENLLRASIPFIKMVVRRQGVATDFVDDVVQDTLLTIHRNRQTYDPSRPFTAWLRTIAQRRAIDIMRSQGRNSRREVYEPLALENYSDPTGNPEDQAEKVNRRSILEVAVATLPTRQREAVEQLAFNEKSLADASVATGLTPGALKVNLHRALNTLRARINIENIIDNCNSSELLPAMRDESTSNARAYANAEHTFVKSAA